MIIHLNENEKTLTDTLTELEGTDTIVQFHATWCGPCKAMNHVVTEATATHPATVIKVDIDQNPVTTAQHQISSVPTFQFHKHDADDYTEYVGMLPTEEFIKQYS